MVAVRRPLSVVRCQLSVVRSRLSVVKALRRAGIKVLPRLSPYNSLPLFE